MTGETNSMLILFIKAVSSDAPWQIVWFLLEVGKESLKITYVGRTHLALVTSPIRKIFFCNCLSVIFSIYPMDIFSYWAFYTMTRIYLFFFSSGRK